MRFLTCEPNFDKSITGYMDEADKFDVNPEEWFLANKDEIKNYTYLVMFENLHKRLLKAGQNQLVSLFLSRYNLEMKFFHSFVETSERTGKQMMLFRIKNLKIAEEMKKNLKEEF
jgi:hypothetical protein